MSPSKVLIIVYIKEDIIVCNSKDCVFETVRHLLCSLVPVVMEDVAQNLVGYQIEDVLQPGQRIDVGDVDLSQVVLCLLHEGEACPEVWEIKPK